ncbi:MAG TPA: hypothetical protein VE961_13410 [Pyrinomonadaceae bacterium]|nr:hypothetical protein [Pyrinomonadaceae bacterium]
MKKLFARALIAFALVFAVTVPALADTIRLKDGSVIRGQIISFKNEQFTILVGGGSRGRKSQITVYMEDVESIDFDSSGAGNTSSQDSSPAYQQPSQPTNQRPANNSPVYNDPGNTTSQPTNPTQPNNNTQTSSNPNPTYFPVNVKVRADNASNGWTNSGLVVRRGQRLRITANGRVGLGGGRFATPDGVVNLPDKDKLMRNQPTGGLICVIGDDNDDFIFIGRSRDFVAQRDGVLFLGVNEGNLADNTGSFDVVVEAEALNSRPD